MILSCHGASRHSLEAQPRSPVIALSLLLCQLPVIIMYHLLPDQLGFLLRREEALFAGNSGLAGQCAALARHTVYQDPQTGAGRRLDRAESPLFYKGDFFRKPSNQEKKKTEEKEKKIQISSVVLKAMKHCLIFNGFICLFEKLYRKINDEEETNSDIVLILNFIFFFYYCVALSVMLLSGLEIPFNAMAI